MQVLDASRFIQEAISRKFMSPLGEFSKKTLLNIQWSPFITRWSGSMTSKRVISEARYRFCRQREPASMSMLHWWLKMQYGAPLSTKTGSDQPCLLWIYCIYLLVYLNKTDTKPEVQMRIFIWNINTNPFPHLKTAHGQPTATAPGSRLRSKFTKLTDHLWIYSNGNYSSNVGSSSE